jgi:predicted phage tail component-like protein
MNGITFNGKHSYNDFNLIMNSKIINTPSKKKIKEGAPGMNSVYDFSTVASSGEIVYNQRAIVVNFTLICDSKSQLHSQLNKITEWIQDIGQSQLIFDDIKDYYFMAELEDSISIVEEDDTVEITINFVAEPFKTGIDTVNNILWDTFNFEEDYLQDTEFDVFGTRIATIYNPGRLVMPIINCSANMSIVKDDITYNLVTGDNNIYGLKLKNGANNIVVNGTGHIKFIFRKVSL